MQENTARGRESENPRITGIRRSFGVRRRDVRLAFLGVGVRHLFGIRRSQASMFSNSGDGDGVGVS